MKKLGIKIRILYYNNYDFVNFIMSKVHENFETSMYPIKCI